METGYWQDRWRRGETGWHRDEVMPLLQKHWPAIGPVPGARVVVPLCGKTRDMPWLAAQGHRVLGIEVAAEGIAAFFAEQGVRDDAVDTPAGRLHHAGAIDILEADAFEVDAATLADARHVYDRAALIALPPGLRRRYVDTLYARLPAGCRGLLITLEYPRHEKAGPPFSVAQAEVDAFAPSWQVELAERRDILAHEPGFRAEGVSALSTAVYRMRRNAG